MDQQDKSAPKWTPGPWEAKQEFANRWRIEAQAGPDCIPLSVGFASTTVLEVGVSNHNTAANAHLIAAAPELYEALKRVVRSIPTDADMRASGWEQPEIDEAHAAYAGARAALAKATGATDGK